MATNVSKMQGLMLREVEVIGPAKDNHRRLLTDDIAGLGVSARVQDSVVLYQLRIPLQGDGEYVLKPPRAGEALSLGFESTRAAQPRMRMEGDEEGGPSGIPGGGEGRTGGWGGGRGSRGGRSGEGGEVPGGEGGEGVRGRRAPVQFQEWVGVTLASPGAAAEAKN